MTTTTAPRTATAPVRMKTRDTSAAILGLATAVPKNRYTQDEIYRLTCNLSDLYKSPRIKQIFDHSNIEHRYLYLEPEEFRTQESIDALHTRYSKGALELGSQAARNAIAEAGLEPKDIDAIFAVSCTGYLCPGLTSLIGREIGLRTDIQRGDIVGMGCCGAMPGLARGSDYVRANTGKTALVVATEICSAAYYFDDTMDTIIGNAICADGAAAAVIGTAHTDHAGNGNGGANGKARLPNITGFESALAPEHMDKVGFDHREGRLRLILSREVRDLAGNLAASLIDRVLKNSNLEKERIAHWVIHPGGRKVIDAVQAAARLTEEQVSGTTTILKNYGNMSSPTVMFVLDRLVREHDPAKAPKPGDAGVMLALGPGMAAEAALLQW